MLGVLLRFREHLVAVSGDMQAMFHLVCLLPQDPAKVSLEGHGERTECRHLWVPLMPSSVMHRITGKEMRK